MKILSETQNRAMSLMETHRELPGFLQFHRLLPLLLLVTMMILLAGTSVVGFGSMGPISAAYGQEDGFFCAIDASGKQEIICWKKNSSTSSTAAYFSSLPPMEALSGGEGFMCGILANTSLAYCWNSINSGKNHVPSIYRRTAYSQIAAGKNHVCGVRGLYFSGTNDSGTVDCWEIVRNSSSPDYVYASSLFSNSANDLVSRTIVSGDGFSCGASKEGGIVCWGPKSATLGVPELSVKLVRLASGMDSLCGISGDSGEVKCWGNIDTASDPPIGTRFFELAAGAHHYCGIRENDHGIECWGNHNTSSIPKGSGFLAISSSDFITCGIREDDLIIHCWSAQGTPPSDYKPPLQLCSPGLCMSGSCDEGKFSFNASILGVPGLTNLCVQPDLNICLPCGLNCSEGFFPSSECSKNSDLVCTACSLCQNDFCSDVCGPLSSSSDSRHQQYEIKRLIIIIGSSILGFTLILITFCILPRKSRTREQEQRDKQCTSCIGTSELETETNASPEHPPCVAPCISKPVVFRLSELKDATNGFREFNELGRGSYGFVYKAILPDGQQVAVKRANAAKIIYSNSRDFEAELDVLCKVRHINIVNLLGYCAEMGERLLVYEFMPHGTLHDHLHGGLSPLNWNLRLKISMQSAKGLEYLHKDAVPPIIHHDVKTSNILLDSEWVARIAGFGLVNSERDRSGDQKSDVYNFGIVLLEILSGRKAYDQDYTPQDIVEWAVPFIRQGKVAEIIDRNMPLPRNLEPLIKVAEIAEGALREDPYDRPIMSQVVLWLEEILKVGLIS